MRPVELDPTAMMNSGNRLLAELGPALAEVRSALTKPQPAGMSVSAVHEVVRTAVRTERVEHGNVQRTAVTLKARAELMGVADSSGSFAAAPPIPGKSPGIFGRVRDLVNNLIRTGAKSAQRDAMRRDVAAWAKAQVGTAKASDADASIFGWSGGPRGEWSYDCITFAKLAWVHGGFEPSLERGNASDYLRHFQGQVDPATGQSRFVSGFNPPPPAGSMVFWGQEAGKLGHVAIADGAGGYISTTGAEGSYSKVQEFKLGSGPQAYNMAPIGYVAPH